MAQDTIDYDTQQGQAAPRKERVDQLNELAWSLLHSDPRRSAALAKQAETLAYTGADLYDYGLAYSLLIQSILEWDRANYTRALHHALHAADLFESAGDVCKQAYTINHIASIHYFMGNASQALELGFAAVQMVESCDDRGLLASLLNDTGYMQLHLGNPQAALEQLERSLAMHREVGSAYGEAQTLDSIGKGYLLLGDTARALRYEQQSLALDRSIGYQRAEAEALGNIGKIYVAAGEPERAHIYFHQSLELARKRGYRQFEAAALLDLGRTKRAQDDLDAALERLQDACAVAEAISAAPMLVEIHEALAETYEQQGDLAASLKHYKLFHALNEAVLNELTTTRLQMLDAMHEAETAHQQTEIYRLKNIALQREIEERERLIAELDAFAHTVAHDLKNPLAVVTGLGELIVEHVERGANAEALDMLREQLHMGYKMGRIVDELLILAHVRREKVALMPLDMAGILIEAKAQLAQPIAESGATIAGPETWPRALGHAPWVEEVWTNYLSNAIKYGGEPPYIEIGATREGDWIRFWVRDNGPGIDRPNDSALFTEFTRLASLSSDRNSHGLGLSIVKRIVEKLDGTVAVESTRQHGSTFSFTLRAAED